MWPIILRKNCSKTLLNCVITQIFISSSEVYSCTQQHAWQTELKNNLWLSTSYMLSKVINLLFFVIIIIPIIISINYKLIVVIIIILFIITAKIILIIFITVNFTTVKFTTSGLLMNTVLWDDNLDNCNSTEKGHCLIMLAIWFNSLRMYLTSLFDLWKSLYDPFKRFNIAYR